MEEGYYYIVDSSVDNKLAVQQFAVEDTAAAAAAADNTQHIDLVKVQRYTEDTVAIAVVDYYSCLLV